MMPPLGVAAAVIAAVGACWALMRTKVVATPAELRISGPVAVRRFRREDISGLHIQPVSYQRARSRVQLASSYRLVVSGRIDGTDVEVAAFPTERHQQADVEEIGSRLTAALNEAPGPTPHR